MEVIKRGDDGATPEPEPVDGSDNCMDRAGLKHAWQWLWVGKEWTDQVRCSTCNLTKTAKMFAGQGAKV
jgi:hypothetical protein